jgi:hypothetical protein
MAEDAHGLPILRIERFLLLENFVEVHEQNVY